MTNQNKIDLNALAGSAVLFALQINIPSTPTVYLVNNNENITYDGNEYIAFNFNISEISAGKGEVPTLTLSLDNTTRIIEQYMLEYDLYLKANGIDGNIITAKLLVLNPNDLSESILEYDFELGSFASGSRFVTFNLTAPSPFNQIILDRILQNMCRFKYKDSRCAATSGLTTCNKTLANCRERNNSARFGGFPGVGKGIRL